MFTCVFVKDHYDALGRIELEGTREDTETLNYYVVVKSEMLIAWIQGTSSRNRREIDRR